MTRDFFESTQVVATRKELGLTWLSGDIDNKDFEGIADPNCLQDIADKQIRQNTRVQTTRPNHDHIGRKNGLDHWRVSRGIVGFKPDAANFSRKARNLAFTFNAHSGLEMR